MLATAPVFVHSSEAHIPNMLKLNASSIFVPVPMPPELSVPFRSSDKCTFSFSLLFGNCQLQKLWKLLASDAMTEKGFGSKLFWLSVSALNDCSFERLKQAVNVLISDPVRCD